MIVFGAVLLILAIIVIAYVWLAMAGESAISIDYGILNVELSPLWFFLAGGITLAVATSGLWLMGVGAKVSARRAKEVRELRRQAQGTDRHGTPAAAVGHGSQRSDSQRSGGDRTGGTRGDHGSGGRGTADRSAAYDVSDVGQSGRPPAGADGARTVPRTDDGPILPRTGSRADDPTDPRRT